MLLVFTSGDNTISGSSTKKRLPQGTGINLIFSDSPAKSLFPLKKKPKPLPVRAQLHVVHAYFFAQ